MLHTENEECELGKGIYFKNISRNLISANIYNTLKSFISMPCTNSQFTKYLYFMIRGGKFGVYEHD